MEFIEVAHAADGDPVALRRWPNGRFSVENHWGLQLQIQSQPRTAAAATAVAQDSASRKHVSYVAGMDHVLSRKVNQQEVTWLPRAELGSDPNSIHVRSIANNTAGCGAIFVQVDGVSIVFLAEHFAPAVDEANDLPIDGVDVIVMPSSMSTFSDAVGNWVHDLKPNHVLISADIDPIALAKFADQIHANESIQHQAHNTFAVAMNEPHPGPTQLTKLDSEPFKLDDELESLFVKMEASCQRSQQVFEALSANQLNFKPANGTHTARWNAEHMMGRQLQFFSQIYHAVDPSIPVIDLNPKQMPPDYVAAHPDWDGQEEARQMQRVSDFTRRYSYLLEGVGLDVRAPESRWTLRGLLSQMERHYDDHTGNTKQKFQLADWPTE